MTSELILEDDAPEGDEEAAAENEQQQPPRLSRTKKLIIAALAGLILLGGGGFALMYFMGASKTSAEDAGTENPVYVELPPMIVNLRGSDGSPRYLKLKLTLMTGDAHEVEKIKRKLPMVLDGFQPFLRELRPEDLSGSAAVFRLKEEMLIRASTAVGEGVVKDVLIQELVQQ